MAIIHNGYFDRRFHESFKGTELNDTDIAITKMYNTVKPMWEQLGFQNDDSDNPNNINYWQNIIPKDFTLANRDGITLESGGDPMKGIKTPRIPYQKYVVDETSSQEWQDGYYYPRIPNINRYGIIDGDTDNLFGSKTEWDGDDEIAPITNNVEDDVNLIMDIDMEQDDTDDLFDKVGFFNTKYNQDYTIDLDDNFRIDKKGFEIPDGLEKNENRQPF